MYNEVYLFHLVLNPQRLAAHFTQNGGQDTRRAWYTAWPNSCDNRRQYPIIHAVLRSDLHRTNRRLQK
jgi:hypothetical protein